MVKYVSRHGQKYFPVWSMILRAVVIFDSPPTATNLLRATMWRGTVASTVSPQPFLYENDACASRVHQILEKNSIVGEKVSASRW
jgi:hypothetical protein